METNASVKKTYSLRETRNTLNEMAYPASFNMKYFKTLESFSKRMAYCNATLQRIASGSARMVFAIDDEKVLKLAKNAKGLAQNETEAGDYYLQTIDLMARTYDIDRDYLWIEMERARKARKEDFKRLAGFSFEFVCVYVQHVVRNFVDNAIGTEIPKVIEDKMSYIDANPEEFSDVFSDITDYIASYRIRNAGDLQRISSWGVVKRNGEERLVLVDYGLDDSVYDKHYSGIK